MSKHMRSLDACDRVIFLITAYRPTWPTVWCTQVNEPLLLAR